MRMRFLAERRFGISGIFLLRCDAATRGRRTKRLRAVGRNALAKWRPCAHWYLCVVFMRAHSTGIVYQIACAAAMVRLDLTPGPSPSRRGERLCCQLAG